MFKKITYIVNAVLAERANDKFHKTHKQIYRDIAVAINAHNELIKTKIASPKNNTYRANLYLHK